MMWIKPAKLSYLFLTLQTRLELIAYDWNGPNLPVRRLLEN